MQLGDFDPEIGWERGRDPFGTHLQAVAWAAAQIGPGEVIEIGAGWWSTPWLHGFCEATSRSMTTIEQNESWLIGIASLYPEEWHKFYVGISYEDLAPMKIALAFIDGGEPYRARYIRAMRNNCQYLICHDTEPESVHNHPDMEEALSDWPNRRDFNQVWPSTTVVWV
jgi:hypothetical protein